jgi:uncharacterized repeat protein (TIGR03803 family)
LFTHWVQASEVSITPSKPHGYWRWLDHTISNLNFKKEMRVYSFTGPAGECGPQGTLVMDGAANLYGTTYCDGANNAGSVFKLTPSNGSWTYTSLYDFTGGNDGANPVSNVVLDGSGNLYGTSSAGGSQGYGVVWEIAP